MERYLQEESPGLHPKDLRGLWTFVFSPNTGVKSEWADSKLLQCV